MLKQLKSQLITLALVAGLLLTPVVSGSTSFYETINGGDANGVMCNGSSGNGTGC